MKELLELIIKNSLPEDTQYSITESADEDNNVVFDIDIPEEFKGRIIGKGGSNINSIRTILSLIARREDKRVLVNIKD